MKQKQNPIFKKMSQRIAQYLGCKPIELELASWDKDDILEAHAELFGRHR